MDAVMERVSVVDEGIQKAAALVTIADDLDKQMTRLATHEQLGEKIDIRLNELIALSVSVDKHREEQVARRDEVEALKNQCDGLGVEMETRKNQVDDLGMQVSDAEQKLQAVSGLQQKLLPLTTEIATIRTQMGKATTAFKGVQQDETELAAQEQRLNELADRSRDVATTVDESLKQIQSVSKELGRASTVKEEVLHELGRVQARQRDVDAYVKTSEDQIKRVDQQLKQIDRRHSKLSFSEKKIADFEERLAELKTIRDDVERQIQALATRETFVRTVKKEVDEVHQISQRSRADLQHVVDHRTQVDAVRNQLDNALKSVGETEKRMAKLETRKKLVDEVETKTNVIVNVLEDVRVNLEMLGEQRAVVDHVVESMAGVNETVQKAQATLKALQTERELGERIERSIKLLRSKTAAMPGDAERKKSA
jgi:chromosome segregation ATPase